MPLKGVSYRLIKPDDPDGSTMYALLRDLIEAHHDHDPVTLRSKGTH